MKLYKQPNPPSLLRINIRKQGEKAEHIAVIDAKQEELLAWIKSLIEKQGLSIFETGKVTVVEVREGEGIKNGKAISFSFKGLKPKQVIELIINEIEK